MLATRAALTLASLLWASPSERAHPALPHHFDAVAVESNASDKVPSCKGFRGKIHGQSACVRYDRALNKLSKSSKRVMPGDSIGELECNGEMRLRTVGIRLDCAQRQPATGRQEMHVVVELVILEDKLYPRSRGKRIVLDEHAGFWDFIHVWVAEDKQSLELTIDYAVLD